jgi:hypothetical protein
VTFHIAKADGHSLWIDLLRPQQWLDETLAEVGGSVYLNLPQLGAVGFAQVLSIEPCPTIAPGSGTVVTGTFRHESDGANVVQLRLDGQSEPTGVTANHPYWSEDRADFVSAAQLVPGERVNTEFGPRAVVSVAPLAYSGILFNLETTEHVYRVGELGTLVHNDCWEFAAKMFKMKGGGVWAMLPKWPQKFTGPLPGYPVGGSTQTSFYDHCFNLKDGILTDPAHPYGISVSAWLKQLAELNGLCCVTAQLLCI